jgi:hypothetical protein
MDDIFNYFACLCSDGQHVISRVETRLSDGSIKVSNGLTPETAKILSKLHPNMFPPEGLIEVGPVLGH